VLFTGGMNLEIISDIPENHGLSSKALLEFFAQMEQLNLDVNSFMLLQDGKATAQFWRKPYRRECIQLLFSLSKSFTSIAVGIAWDNGFMDLQDKVISFFPDKLPETISSNLEKMTIHHLLSMNTGHHDNIYGILAKEEDWVKTFLSLEVLHEPGTYYLYNTHATYMLSAILERITCQDLIGFLMPRLFGPLGIPKPSWETCPKGIVAGGMGLSINTESIAKFGQMLLNKGIYNGKRIISEKYLDLATREQSDNRRNDDKIDSAQGYGYQFHLCRRGAFRGDGAFGQLCFVAPKENIVIAATSSFKNMKQLQTLLDLINKYIIDKLDKDSFQCLDDHNALELQLSSIMSPFSELQPLPDDIRNINNLSFDMDENPHNLEKLNFYMKGEQLEVELYYEDESNNKFFPFNITQPVHFQDVFTKDLSHHRQEVVTYVSWLDKNAVKLTLVYIETPYVVTYTLRFEYHFLHLQFNMNVSFSPIKEFKVSGKQLMKSLIPKDGNDSETIRRSRLQVKQSGACCANEQDC
jgi:hypothetical protein